MIKNRGIIALYGSYLSSLSMQNSNVLSNFHLAEINIDMGSGGLGGKGMDMVIGVG